VKFTIDIVKAIRRNPVPGLKEKAIRISMAILIPLMITFIGASSLCYLFLYRPTSKKAAKGAREIAALEVKLKNKIHELNTVQAEIEKIRKAGPETPPVQISTNAPVFLEKINKEANRFGIRIVAAKPLPPQKFPEYIRHPFLIEAKSKYAETVKFIHSLEASGLSVDDLHIQNDPKDPLRHRFKFSVSTFQFRDRI